MKLWLILSLFPAISAVTLYEHVHFLGSNESFPGLLEVDKCFHINWLSDKVSSVDTEGGCVVLHSLVDCKGDSVPIYPGSGGEKKLSEVGFDNKVRSVTRCSWTYLHSAVRCSEGGFVQRIAAAGTHVEITCYNPVEQTRETHMTFGHAIGATNWTRGALTGISCLCPLNGTCDFSAHTFYKECCTTTAVTGFNMQYETHTNTIKDIDIHPYCANIPQYRDTCTVNASLVQVVACDATIATTSTNCSFTRKIGFAPEESASKSEQFNWFDEMEFKSDFWNIAHSIANKFRFNSLNGTTSRAAGYNWTSAPDTIWDSEIVGKEEFLEVTPGTLSVLVQMVGTCGFFRVRTEQFTRIDYDRYGTEIKSSKYVHSIEMQEITSRETILIPTHAHNPGSSTVWMTITGILVGLLLLVVTCHLIQHCKKRVRIAREKAVNRYKTSINGDMLPYDLVDLVQL